MTIDVSFEGFQEMMDFAKQMAGKTEDKPLGKQAATALQQPAEEAPAPEVYTMEDVRKKLLELNKAGKKDKVAELIKSFGVDKFPQVPPEKYGELMAKAEAL